jgi:UDP-N-acetylmuramate dehydrogenase
VKSAGSFFKNPPQGPAGRLIEQAGCKGVRVGRAFVSEKHANFIVHKGGASAEDILRLSRQVAREVYRMFGVRLEREVELWGRFGSGRRKR